MEKQPQISDLAVISDRHSCAITDCDGAISWYCPGRFDNDALMSFLIDKDSGGYWSVTADGKEFASRQFQNRSSVLNTYFTINGKGFTVTDFMPVNYHFTGICRKFSKTPEPVLVTIKLTPGFGLEEELFSAHGDTKVYLNISGLWLHTSHPVKIDDGVITFNVPKGQEGWAALIDQENLLADDIENSLTTTLERWEEIETYIDYHGPFENEVRDSLRALQQLVYEPTGGIIAAATTSLPEVIGGKRNYDYRYVWMRDAALITGSLVQIESSGKLENDFLSFISGAMDLNKQDHVSCFYTIDQKIKRDSSELPVSGYMKSKPVQLGNTAADQFQLDAESNILLASKLIYDKYGEKKNWETVVKIADFICKNWERKDNGIWEEEQLQHYTSSKAFAARGLELMAPFQEDKVLAQRWLDNAALIRQFIDEHCKTKSGAYAVFAGSENVDITAALYVPWGFDKPDSEAMLATISQIEKDYADSNLYRRHLEEFDSDKEGVFLAGSCWMAHYYCIAGDLIKANQIFESLLRFKNDLGYFSEQGDTKTGAFLGNFSQTFVHSSFICAVEGYKKALAGIDSSVKS